jgi:hypothetical protein
MIANTTEHKIFAARCGFLQALFYGFWLLSCGNDEGFDCLIKASTYFN